MESGYSAGSLEFDIGINKKTISKIYSTASSLGKLASSLNKINNTQFVYAGDKLEVIFTKIARATNSINTSNMQNLASAAKSLSAISRLSNLEKLDFAKVGAGFRTLSIDIQPFLDRVKEAEASLVALDGILKRSSGGKIKNILDGNNGKNRNGIFGFAKMGVNLYMMRRMGRFMENLVQAGSDYNETLNLWQVAMRNNLDVADQFVNKMQKAYGISSKTLMNAQAVFKNMVGSLGQISDATAYALSEALVQMSADYASLYNRTLESAFQNMQSMLAGQVRPIRSAGLDITETTLYQFYQQLGGTKSMRQLNRTEKQLLSILAVYKQMGSAGALGDMTKTLNQFANQSRMMTEYWAELKTWSGLLVKDLIDQSGLLVYINALLITTTEIIKAIAKSRGLGDDNYITGMFEAVEATNEAVDELQGKLLDFDKFRSLDDNITSPLAIDEKVLEAITGYNSQIDQSINKAQILAEKWTSFWIDDNGELTQQAELLLDVIDAILMALILMTGTKILTGLHKVFTNVKDITLHTEALGLMLGGAFLIKGIQNLIENWDKFNVQGQNTIITLSAIAGLIAGILTMVKTGSPLLALGVGMGVGGISLYGLPKLFEKIPWFTSNISQPTNTDNSVLYNASQFGTSDVVYQNTNSSYNRQMNSAEFQSALNGWWSSAKNDIPAFKGMSESGIYTIVDGEAKRRGLSFNKR